MNLRQRQAVGRNIRYELQNGTHTYSMCQCGRHGCRLGKCWECFLEILENNPKVNIDFVKDEEQVK